MPAWQRPEPPTRQLWVSPLEEDLVFKDAFTRNVPKGNASTSLPYCLTIASLF